MEIKMEKAKPLSDEELKHWENYQILSRKGQIDPEGDDAPFTEDYLERLFATIHLWKDISEER